MSKYIILTFYGCCILLALFSFAEPISTNEIPYPEGYRDWVHVKSKFVGPKSMEFRVNAGFNHTYANDLAMTGYVTGNFPEGSVIIFDVINAREDSINFGIKESGRQRIDVMIKDSTRYKVTGGWGYGQFRGDGKSNEVVTLDAATKCFQCHTSQKDFVFSEFRK